METFQIEKAKLLNALTNESNQPQNKKNLQQLIDKVRSLKRHDDFAPSLTQSIREVTDLSPTLRAQLLNFDTYFRNKVNWIQSRVLREIARHLLEKNITMTFYGRTWTKQTADWMYFDTVLDIEGLQKKFNFGDHIQNHENLDPHSGTERGLLDSHTGEGIIGRLN